MLELSPLNERIMLELTMIRDIQFYIPLNPTVSNYG